MDQPYREKRSFDRIDYRKRPLQKGEYDRCSFDGCDFSESDLSEFKFVDCRFVRCNLSLANLSQSSLQGVVFKECKMAGLRFDTCNEFGLSFSFETCSLNHSTFYRTKIKKTLFRNSQLHEVDFTECDLTGSVFDQCDLERALFHRTVIEKADFRSSYNYSIDPENNRIKKAMFSLPELVGLLDKYDIKIDKTH